MARNYMEEMAYVIGHNESSNSYTSINATDVVSIGLFNWYGARALGLARTIAQADPSGSQTALSSASTPLYNQITSGDNNIWNNYVPGKSSADMSALRAFLDLPASHTAQDSLALTDSYNYSSQAKSRGITDPACQIYFADLYNQSPRQAGNIITAVGAGKDNLASLHAAAMANPVMKKYSTRRNWTFNELSTWSTGGGGEPPVTPPVNPPNSNGGGNIPPSAYALTDYIIMQNGIPIHYSQQNPLGISYVPVNNVYIPSKQTEGEES